MNKMKRSFMHIKIIAVVMLLLSACSQEDEYVTKGDNEIPSEGIELTISATDFVTDGAPDTRATDNGNKTTFDDGDRVGVIILDASDNPIYDNIPYVYNNGSWTFGNNDNGKGGCYYDPNAETFIVYYPYSRAADRVTSVDGLKAKFAPKFNQSDIEDYRASDLMVWSSSSSLLIPPVKKLNAELKHVFASISLSPIAKYTLEDGSNTKCIPTSLKISDVSLTTDNAVYVPNQAADGSLRCIVPVNINPDIRCFYTFNGTTYGNTINIQSTVTPNTRYTSSPEIISPPYTLADAKVGDFYCKRSDNNEGYLIPGDVALTDVPKDACVGIVMKVGKDDNGSWKDDCLYKFKGNSTPMDIIHGYVLALHNANGGNTCLWGSYGTLVGTNTEQSTGFYGYNNTQTIIDYDKNNGKNLQNNFPATYHATTGYESISSAPTNSSGWFLPSAGQCWYWYLNRDAIWTSMNKAGGNGWGNYYWSSSESSNTPTNYACYVRFDRGNVIGADKRSNVYVRSCLAF